MSKGPSTDLDTLRHSTAHVMAAAVCRLFDDVQLDIGPATDDGFYYDFDLPHRLAPEDFRRDRGGDGAGSSRRTCPSSASRSSARRGASGCSRSGARRYKLERLADIPGGRDRSPSTAAAISWTCAAGPHVESTGEIRAFKLMSVAGSYFRGIETNPMLQRLYGTAVRERRSSCAVYLKQLEEAKKRDHRKLGSELDLFSIQEDVGPGLVHWHPRGRAHPLDHRGFLAPRAFPRRLRAALHARTSGAASCGRPRGTSSSTARTCTRRWTIDGNEYFIKPMNCPFHIQIYKTQQALLPRPAAALGGAGHGLPLREERGAARAAARARVHPGRRAHLLHAGADRGRDRARRSVSPCGMLARLRVRGHHGLPGHPPGEGRGRGGALGAGHRARWKRRCEAEGIPYEVDRGRRRLLRPEDRPEDQGRPRPRVADEHDPVRLQPAGAVRPDLHRRGRRGAPALHGAPRPARQPGAVLRHPDRALRRGVSRSGWRPSRSACCR